MRRARSPRVPGRAAATCAAVFSASGETPPIAVYRDLELARAGARSAVGRGGCRCRRPRRRRGRSACRTPSRGLPWSSAHCSTPGGCRVNELDQALEHGGVGPRQDAVAEVEDVPRGRAAFVEDPSRCHPGGIESGEADRRVEIALESRVRPDSGTAARSSGTRQSTPTTSAPAVAMRSSSSPVPTPNRMRGTLKGARPPRIRRGRGQGEAFVVGTRQPTQPSCRRAGPRSPRPRPGCAGRRVRSRRAGRRARTRSPARSASASSSGRSHGRARPRRGSSPA